MKQRRKQILTAIGLMMAGLLGGCVSISSGTISTSQNGSTGSIVHSSVSHDGFFEVFGTHNDSLEANNGLAAQCSDSQLTDVVDQVSKRDVFLLVQIYTTRAEGVCLPVLPPMPVPVKAPVVLPPVHQLVHAVKTKRGVIFTLGSVLFATNKATLNENARNSVNELTAYLQDHPSRIIRIEGYTDSTGTKKFNQVLSVHRAESVKDALIKGGIGSNRIHVEGYGPTFPVATNKTMEGRQLNRRVEVVISDKKGQFLQKR